MSADRFETIAAARRRQDERLRRLLASDKAAAAEEERRIKAIEATGQGVTAAIDDARIPPTPERMAKGDFQQVKAAKDHWTHRSTTTWRDMNKSRVMKLHAAGVIDDDQFAACVWYRGQWDTGQLMPAAPVSAYEPRVPGEPNYGHLPRTMAAAEARQMYRYARGRMPADFVDMFELVVLHDASLREAMRLSRCRYRNVRAAFVHAALACHEIARPHILIGRTFTKTGD